MKLYLLLPCLLLDACTTTLPMTRPLPGMRVVPDMRIVDVSYDDASKHRNDIVRWGGVLMDVENKEDYSLVQVEFHPLEESGRPQVSEPNEAHFVIKTPRFLDPEVYIKYSGITVTGMLDGDIKRTVNGKCILVPLLVLSDNQSDPSVSNPVVWEAADVGTDYSETALEKATPYIILGIVIPLKVLHLLGLGVPIR